MKKEIFKGLHAESEEQKTRENSLGNYFPMKNLGKKGELDETA